MTEKHPPRVELSDRRLGALEVLRRGRTNVVSIIPAQLLKEMFASGRVGWKWYSIAGPDQTRRVLVENVGNYPRSPLVHRVLAPAFRRALFLDEGVERKWYKSLVSPHFQKTAARAQVGLFLDCAAEHCANLPTSTRFELDVFDFMVEVTLSVICQSITSSPKEDALDKSRFRAAFFSYLDKVARVSVLDLLRLPTWLVMGLRPGRARMLRHVRDEIDGVVSRRIAEGARGRIDLLQSLIEARHPSTCKPMPPDQIRDIVLLCLFAGHETISGTLAWAVFLLAGRADLQDVIRKEVRPDPLAEAREIPDHTPMLDAVINETMRLYPGGPLLVRQVRRDDEVAGCPVSRGAFMFVPIYALHRNQSLWDDPNSFRPERFLPENTGDVLPYQFLPFSAGPNSCIGAGFAQVEMRAILADFVQRFRFQVSANHPTPEPKAILTMKPAGGVWIKAERM